MSDYIPSILITDILARLPVDDVLRCTSVCKSWYELITTCPSFASSHLNLSNQEPLVLLKSFKHKNSKSSFCLHRDNQRFDEIAELDVPICFGGNECLIVDSINGLVCIRSPYRCCDIVLWNPSLRKSFILPNSRVLSDSHVSYSHTIGFGFVATSNDYKIFKYSYASKNSYPSRIKTEAKAQAEIFELSTGSWHNVKLEDSFGGIGAQAHLNGVLHWTSGPGYTSADFIFSFDLKNEKCGKLMVPNCLRHVDVDVDADDYDACYILSTFRESLCLIDATDDGFWKIWVMKEYGVSDSWEELFYINTDHHDLCFLYFWDNGEIFFDSYCQNSRNRKLVSYDCTDKRVTNIELFAECLVTSVHTYVESLALINIPNEVNIDKE